MAESPIVALNPSMSYQMGVSGVDSYDFSFQKASQNLSLANGFWTSHPHWMLR